MKADVTDELDVQDRTEITRIITNMHRAYQQQVHQAESDLHEAKRAINRAEHRLHRLERHRAKIEQFCADNNVAIGNER